MGHELRGDVKLQITMTHFIIIIIIIIIII